MDAVILQFPRMAQNDTSPPNRIREWRKAKGFTQVHMSKATGLDQTFLSRIENGDRALTLHHMQIIAAALGVDSGALLNREDNRFGLDEKGIEVLDYLQASPQIAPALATVAEALKPYSPSPSTATLAMPGKAKRTKQPAN